MTEEDKNLILIDLCGRLPYDIVINDEYGDYINVNIYNAHIEHLIDRVVSGLDKMVLRPISSMTEKEKEELRDTYDWLYSDYPFDDEDEDEDDVGCHPEPSAETYDWYNRKMFDYRGLITRGLANEAPESVYTD